MISRAPRRSWTASLVAACLSFALLLTPGCVVYPARVHYAHTWLYYPDYGIYYCTLHHRYWVYDGGWILEPHVSFSLGAGVSLSIHDARPYRYHDEHLRRWPAHGHPAPAHGRPAPARPAPARPAPARPTPGRPGHPSGPAPRPGPGSGRGHGPGQGHGHGHGHGPR